MHSAVSWPPDGPPDSPVVTPQPRTRLRRPGVLSKAAGQRACSCRPGPPGGSSASGRPGPGRPRCGPDGAPAGHPDPADPPRPAQRGRLPGPTASGQEAWFRVCDVAAVFPGGHPPASDAPRGMGGSSATALSRRPSHPLSAPLPREAGRGSPGPAPGHLPASRPSPGTQLCSVTVCSRRTGQCWARGHRVHSALLGASCVPHAGPREELGCPPLRATSAPEALRGAARTPVLPTPGVAHGSRLPG